MTALLDTMVDYAMQAWDATRPPAPNPEFNPLAGVLAERDAKDRARFLSAVRERLAQVAQVVACERDEAEMRTAQAVGLRLHGFYASGELTTRSTRDEVLTAVAEALADHDVHGTEVI